MSITYSIILPAYNEAANIERAIRETAAVFDRLGPHEIIVVDDASRDETASLASALPVRLLRHEVNCGKGTAVRTGVMNASGEYILFLDCDLATHPSEAFDFIEKIKDADIVIGSRRVPGADIVKRQPWSRSLSSRLFNFFIRIFLDIPYRDTQCGFKMFRHNAAQTIFKDLGPARWTFDIEILMRARAFGYRVLELPISWRHGSVSRVRVGEVLSDLGHLWRLKKKLKK